MCVGTVCLFHITSPFAAVNRKRIETRKYLKFTLESLQL